MIGANTTVSIYNMTYGASTNTFPGSPNLTGVEAYIESQRGEILQALDQTQNIEVFLMYCDPVTIDMGDKVVDANSIEYRVTGIEKHENNTDSDDLYVVTLHKERNSNH